MRYNVAQLLKGPTGVRRKYLFREEIGSLDPELEPVQPLSGEVTLLRTSQGILVTGRLTTTLQLTCRRCLEPCLTEVEINLEEEFFPTVHIADTVLDKAPDEDYEDALLIDEHHLLDLTEVIRQNLWLAIPMEVLCRPDCAGLCPRCGGNRNLGECHCAPTDLDPRWAALLKLNLESSDSNERSD